MTKLKRQPDGSYRGSYAGHEFTVSKVDVSEEIVAGYVRTETHWVARSGTIEHRSKGNRATRDDAVRGIKRELDMATVHVPEMDAMLKRWASEIGTIVPLLGDRDEGARMQLENLSFELSSIEALVRHRAVHFEEQLAKLKARIQQAAEQPTLEARP